MFHFLLLLLQNCPVNASWAHCEIAGDMRKWGVRANRPVFPLYLSEGRPSLDPRRSLARISFDDHSLWNVGASRGQPGHSLTASSACSFLKTRSQVWIKIAYLFLQLLTTNWSVNMIVFIMIIPNLNTKGWTVSCIYYGLIHCSVLTAPQFCISAP